LFTGQPLAEIELLVSITMVMNNFTPVLINPKDKSCEIDYFSGATIRPKNIKNLKLVPMP
jgi:hypothetical protein